MSAIAPTLEAFFITRLIQQREVSSHTIASYRDTFRLLFNYVHVATGKQPSKLDFEDLNAPAIGAFLEHLLEERGNSVRTRNARLAAIHSFFRYASFQHPEHVDLILRVLSIPHKRGDRALVAFLTSTEVAAILAAPNRSTLVGRRDHALLMLAIQTGLRLSELINLRCSDIHFGAGAYVRCLGKGRKDRCTPLTKQTAAVLRVWLAERRRESGDILFPSRFGGRLSADAVSHLLDMHVTAASQMLPSLRSKRVTPHVLRHTSAMQLLHSGVDTAAIALWLGHESSKTTQVYLHADLSLKERALSRTTPATSKPGRYRPTDHLLAFLDHL